MAVRTVAVIVVGGAARAAASACPDSTNPMIGIVTDLAPKCFEDCPQVCQPLDGLITEYLATSDTDAIQSLICAAPEPFKCMFEADHIGACGTVLSAGSALGVQLPMSEAELMERCGLSDSDASTAVCPDSTNPMISVVTDLSPKCFRHCPQVCQPLDVLVTEYLATMDTDAVQASICAAPGPFACMFEEDHFGECVTVLSAGSALGVQLPMSEAELMERCGSGDTTSDSDGSSSQAAAHHDLREPNIPEDGNATGDDTLSVISAASRGLGWARTVAPFALSVVAAIGFAA